MRRLYQVTCALALVSCVALAQESYTTTQHSESTTVNPNGSVTRTQTETITVTTYETRLREAYFAIGIPQPIVDQLLAIDIEIYNAELRGDFDRVRVLREREVGILGPTWIPRVETYFTEHPFDVNLKPGFGFAAWRDVSGGKVDESRARLNTNTGERGKAAVSGNRVNATPASGQVQPGSTQLKTRNAKLGGAIAPSSASGGNVHRRTESINSKKIESTPGGLAPSGIIRSGSGTTGANTPVSGSSGTAVPRGRSGAPGSGNTGSTPTSGTPPNPGTTGSSGTGSSEAGHESGNVHTGEHSER